MYTSYRPSTPTGEPIRVDRSSSVLLFTLRHFNEMQHFPNAVHAFFYLKTRLVDCSRERYSIYCTCISKLESTETSFSGRKFFGGLQQNYSLITQWHESTYIDSANLCLKIILAISHSQSLRSSLDDFNLGRWIL